MHSAYYVSYNPTYPPARDYHDSLRGFADGVHSVDRSLKVIPGGYAAPDTWDDWACAGLTKSIADLLNNGTLDRLCIHNYSGSGYESRSAQNCFDKVKKAAGIRMHIPHPPHGNRP